MGLEVATYIDGLNPAWPLNSDFLREADDHMRLIKSTLLNTLPNITGPVNANQAELNLLVGATTLGTPGGVDTQIQYNNAGVFNGNNSLVFDGTTTTAEAITVTGNFISQLISDNGALVALTGDFEVTSSNSFFEVKASGGIYGESDQSVYWLAPDVILESDSITLGSTNVSVLLFNEGAQAINGPTLTSGATTRSDLFLRNDLGIAPDGSLSSTSGPTIGLKNADDEWVIQGSQNAETNLYFNGLATAETAAAASGGMLVNNTLTGAGFERVLTTSDAGGGVPAGADQEVQFNNAGAFGASSNLTWNGATLKSLNVIAGNPGNEGTGILINGVQVDSTLKSSSIGGSDQAQFIIHRHSTTITPALIAAHSNSDTNAHGDVVDDLELFAIRAVGWFTDTYEEAARINFVVDGTPGANDMPGRIEFATTPDGSDTPVNRLIVDNAGDIWHQNLSAPLNQKIWQWSVNTGNGQIALRCPDDTGGGFAGQPFSITRSGTAAQDATLAVNDQLFLGGNTEVRISGALVDMPTATEVRLGTMSFDADQVIGAGQDNFVLTYDNGTGLISLEAGGGGGNVSNTGTPLLSQSAWWTDATTIEGKSTFTYNTGSARYQFTNTGGISIPATRALYLDGGGNTYITESSANTIALVTNGFARLTASTATVAVLTNQMSVGGTNSDVNLYLEASATDDSAIRFRRNGVEEGRIFMSFASDEMNFNLGGGIPITLDSDGLFTGDRISERGVTMGAGVDIDVTDGTYHFKTITALTTFTFSNPDTRLHSASSFTLELINPGAFAITWPGSVQWPGGTEPTWTVSGTDIVSFVTRDAGTTWRGFLGGQAFA